MEFLWNITPSTISFGRRSLIVVIVLVATLLLSTNFNQTDNTSLRLAVHTLQLDDATFQEAQGAHFDTIVQVFPWREVEPTRDQYHWDVTDQIVAGAEYYGLTLIVRLDQHPAWASGVDLGLNAPPDDLEDYADYVERVVTRYRGRVPAYIIWNEPNLSIEWGGKRPDPEAFVELMKVGYEAVKAADPEALVVSAGLAPTNNNDAIALDERLFLREMYAAGAGDYFDILGAHPYSFGQAPQIPDTASDQPAFDRLAEQRAIMIEYGDSHKPVWITEMGWTVAPPPEQAYIEVTLEEQATYLADAVTMIEQDWPWVNLITVWNLSVPTPGDPFGGYSLLDEQTQPRPVHAAWKQVAASLAEKYQTVRRLSDVPVTDSVQILADDMIVHLGDDFEGLPAWWPLYGGRSPSLQWTGGFYLSEAMMVEVAQAEIWTLSIELMQQSEIGNPILINGTPLLPALPQQDFTMRWLTTRLPVPTELLRPGYNEITVTTVRLLPDAQHGDFFIWGDFQFRNIQLRP